jgi:quercetin dioxygenase-like cupin family protein/oxalate decarboxylase/phosphoglucose isomerase-like protein (cupin superfamily)
MVTTDLSSSADITESLAPLERIDAYEQWQKAEGAPVISGFYIEDLNTVALGPWPRKGSSVSGAFVNLEGTGGVNDMHLIELAPGGASDPERHIYEAMIYVLSGRGSTQVWYSEDRKASFEWGPGSLFAVPINANYRIFNSSGVQPARYVAVTNAPTIVSLFHNDGFVFDNSYVFEDRFSGGDDYFAGEGVLHRGRTLETNFVPNVHTIQLHDWKARGGGGTNVMIELAQNSMGAHISQFKPGTYKKAHRHGPGAHVIILDGVGFSLLWREGDETRQKCDWRPGAVVVPPENWFHEHFNSGPDPARYLALRFTGIHYKQRGAYQGGAADVSVKLGGAQIEYEDEDPAIHELFERELASHGATCRMKGLVPWCRGDA